MNFSKLIGHTLKVVEVNQDKNKILFITTTGRKFRLWHKQECCEFVLIEDICGDLQDLIGNPILNAKEAVSNINPPNIVMEDQEDSHTWTFYRLSTIKGTVVIRWYGESSGSYSESVDFDEVSQ